MTDFFLVGIMYQASSLSIYELYEEWIHYMCRYLIMYFRFSIEGSYTSNVIYIMILNVYFGLMDKRSAPNLFFKRYFCI